MQIHRCWRQRARVPAVRFVRAALPALPFEDGTFDVVVANFVVNHLENPRSGIAELGRVAAEAGRLSVTIWSETKSIIDQLWADIVEASGANPPPADRLLPANDFPRSAEGLGQLLIGAGLQDVRVDTIDWELRIDPEHFWLGPAGGMAAIGKVVTAQSPQTQARMKDEYDRLIAALLDGASLTLPARALLATATKAH